MAVLWYVVLGIRFLTSRVNAIECQSQMNLPLFLCGVCVALDCDRFLGRDLLEFQIGAYGGHVVSQALNAAVKTMDNAKYLIRSVHCYYLNPVKVDTDVIYHVARLKDGRSVSTRGVRATQGEKEVFNCLASFSVEETEQMGLCHSGHLMPQVDPPVGEPTVEDERMSIPFEVFPMRVKPTNLKNSKELHQPR